MEETLPVVMEQLALEQENRFLMTFFDYSHSQDPEARKKISCLSNEYPVSISTVLIEISMSLIEYALDDNYKFGYQEK